METEVLGTSPASPPIWSATRWRIHVVSFLAAPVATSMGPGNALFIANIAKKRIVTCMRLFPRVGTSIG